MVTAAERGNEILKDISKLFPFLKVSEAVELWSHVMTSTNQSQLIRFLKKKMKKQCKNVKEAQKIHDIFRSDDSTHTEDEPYVDMSNTISKELILFALVAMFIVGRPVTFETLVKNEDGAFEFNALGAHAITNFVFGFFLLFFCIMSNDRYHMLSFQSAFNYCCGRGLYGFEILFFYMAIANMDAVIVDSLSYIVLPLVGLKTALSQNTYKRPSLMVTLLIAIITVHLAFKASNDSLFNEPNFSIFYAMLAALSSFFGDCYGEYFLQSESEDLVLVATYCMLVDGTTVGILAILLNVSGIQTDYSIAESFDLRNWGNQTIWINQGNELLYVTCASLLLTMYGAAAKNIAVYIGRLMAYIVLSLLQEDYFDYETFSLILVLSTLAITYQFTEALDFHHALDALYLQIEVSKTLIVLYCNRFILLDKKSEIKSELTLKEKWELQSMMFRFADGTGDFLIVDLNVIESRKDWDDRMKKEYELFAENVQNKINDLSGLIKHPKVEAKVNIGDNESAGIQTAFDIGMVSTEASGFTTEESDVVIFSLQPSSNSSAQPKSSSSAESDSITVFDVPNFYD